MGFKLQKSKTKHSVRMPCEHDEILLQQAYKKFDGNRRMSGFIGVLINIGLSMCHDLSDKNDFQRLVIAAIERNKNRYLENPSKKTQLKHPECEMKIIQFSR